VEEAADDANIRMAFGYVYGAADKPRRDRVIRAQHAELFRLARNQREQWNPSISIGNGT
jgi:hypothetical protein